MTSKETIKTQEEEQMAPTSGNAPSQEQVRFPIWTFPESSPNSHGSPLPIQDVLAVFLRKLDAVAFALSPTMSFARIHLGAKALRIERFLKENGELKEAEGEAKSYGIPPAELLRFQRLKRDYESAEHMCAEVPSVFIIGMVGHFDYFVGCLLKALLEMKPDIMKSFDRNISLGQLMQFEELAGATEYLVDKEVETLLRKSHAEQIDWFEKRFSVNLRGDEALWSRFIELTERRNLLAHCNGVVSEQYIKLCVDANVELADRISVGTKLGVGPQYHANAHACLYEFAVKLSQVLWRKVGGNGSLEHADGVLNDVTYDLLASERYNMALRLLDFACADTTKAPDENSELTHAINRAIALKFSGAEQEQVNKSLSSVDWSAKAEKFLLAVAVLQERFDDAAKHMLSLGNEGPITSEYYRDWPLFREFRSTPQFEAAFRDVFDQEFPLVTAGKVEASEQDESESSAQSDTGTTPPTELLTSIVEHLGKVSDIDSHKLDRLLAD